MNRFFSAVALILSLLGAGDASATDSRLDKLIEQGLRLRRDGKPAEALELFRQAHAIGPTPRTFGQMGLVETSLRLWVEGENHLSVSLANPDDPWVLKNRAFLDEALSFCRQHVGDLVVSGEAGAEVFVGGKSVGTLPVVPALRLAEGTVTVTASAPGFQPFERTVTIQSGVRTPLAISLIPVATAPTPVIAPTPPLPAAQIAPAPAPTLVTASGTPTEQPKRSSWHTWAGIGIGAAGTAAIGWGAYWIYLDEKCPADRNGGCKSLTDGTYETRTPGWILVSVGGAALVGGVVILFTRPSAGGSNVALGLTPSSVLLETRF